MELKYRILNVFTAGGVRLSGNPLCVIEDGSGLDPAQMQALARQFNVSETTFILPSKRAAALVRIFTPAYEMPFAGHPTLGTAHVCRALGLGGDQLGLEMRAGIIPVTASGDHWTLRAAAATSRLVDMPPAEIAKWLGLEASDIGFQPLWIKAGREQLVIPLTSEAAVRRVKPRLELFDKLKSVDGASQAYVFASTGAKKILSRFFFTDGPSILEDPATGSACANLGSWFSAMGRRPPLNFEVSQGEYVGRPSTLLLEVNADNEVFVGGDVIEIGSGILNL
jgi:trans-2,3-dihydro-3-hydroxyanthranilate isomerase